jgi:hypothetical protein
MSFSLFSGSLASGNGFNALVQYPDCEDAGAVVISGSPLNPGGAIQAGSMGKGFSELGTGYVTLLTNVGQACLFNLEGGRLQNTFDDGAPGTPDGFLGEGSFSVGAGYANRIRLGVTYGGADHGAVYCSPTGVPINAGEVVLVCTDHSKMQQPDGSIWYRMTMWSSLGGAAYFSIEGGSFAGAWDADFSSGTIAPGSANGFHVYVQFAPGDGSFSFGDVDAGAQFLMATADDPGSEVIARSQIKMCLPDGGYQYRALLVNEGGFATTFHMQGGGFA